MKNKSTLTLYTFFLLSFLSFMVNAQDKDSNKDFTIQVIKLSDKPILEKEHWHIIELKNTSQITSEYTISIMNDICSAQEDNNKKNNLGFKKIESNINTEIYFIDVNKKQPITDIISLKPNESVKIQLKTKQKDNAKLDSKNCSVITATKVSQNKLKGSKSNSTKFVTIETFVRNPINKGH